MVGVKDRVTVETVVRFRMQFPLSTQRRSMFENLSINVY